MNWLTYTRNKVGVHKSTPSQSLKVIPFIAIFRIPWSFLLLIPLLKNESIFMAVCQRINDTYTWYYYSYVACMLCPKFSLFRSPFFLLPVFPSFTTARISPDHKKATPSQLVWFRPVTRDQECFRAASPPPSKLSLLLVASWLSVACYDLQYHFSCLLILYKHISPTRCYRLE